MTLASTLISLLLAGKAAQASTWLIESDGSGDAPTIQAGIDSAVAGDTVQVACGTYYEFDVLIMTSGITLKSETGDPACVTIDAQALGRVLNCVLLDNTTRIEGFTVTGGSSGGGGGVRCFFSSPHISNCIFNLNFTPTDGGGMLCDGSSPTLTDCQFDNNSADEEGGGIACRSGSTPVLSNCQFSLNSAVLFGGGMSCRNSSPILDDCTFSDNLSGYLGGGLACYRYSNPALTTCSFFRNTADLGGGVSCWNSSPSLSTCSFLENSAEFGGPINCHDRASPSIENCSFANNSAGQFGSTLYCNQSSTPTLNKTIVAFGSRGNTINCLSGSSVGLSCSNIYGNVDGDWVGCIAGQAGISGNFSAEPLFCDAPNGDFTLHANSPCAPGNHPDGANCGLIGALPVACGSTTATEETSWTEVKEMFR